MSSNLTSVVISQVLELGYAIYSCMNWVKATLGWPLISLGHIYQITN